MPRLERHLTLPDGVKDPASVPEQDKGEAFLFWCPGCDTHHRYDTKLARGATGPTWGFNRDMECPTFTPSLHYVGYCHLFLTNGQLRYCGDSKHALAGKTIDLPELP